MKNLSLALNVILFVLVAILFAMYFSLKKSINGGEQTPAAKADTAKSSGPLRIAYINLDTMSAGYSMMKDLRDEMQQKQNTLQKEFNAKNQNLQQEYMEYQQKAQAGNISQVDAEKVQKDMQKKKSELDQLQEQESELEQEIQVKNVELQQKLSNYIAQYNKTAHFDYVLGYAAPGSGNPVLFTNKRYDITKAILEGINKQYQDSIQNAKAKH